MASVALAPVKFRARPDKIAKPRISEVVSVRALIARVVKENQVLVMDAIRAGICSKPPYSYAYLRLAAEYLDGRPEQNIDVKHGGAVLHVHAEAEQLASVMSSQGLAELEAFIVSQQDSQDSETAALAGAPDIDVPQVSQAPADPIDGHDPETDF